MRRPDLDAYAERFLADVDEALRSRSRPNVRRVVLLSGGVDSFLILASVVRNFGADLVDSLTIRSTLSDELRRAKAATTLLGVSEPTVADVCIDDVAAIVDEGRARGRGFDTFFDFMYWALMEIAFDRYEASVGPLRGADVYAGEFADIYHGSAGAPAYLNTKKLSESLGISASEARRRIRREVFEKETGVTVACFRDSVERRGGSPILPFHGGHLDWYLDVPVDPAILRTKRHILSAVRRLWGLPTSTTKRVTFQAGTGLYEALRSWVEETSGMKAGEYAKAISK